MKFMKTLTIIISSICLNILLNTVGVLGVIVFNNNNLVIQAGAGSDMKKIENNLFEFFYLFLLLSQNSGLKRDNNTKTLKKIRLHGYHNVRDQFSRTSRIPKEIIKF